MTQSVGMTKSCLILWMLLCSLALAQTPAWPPKPAVGQTWQFVLSSGGQNFRWTVNLKQTFSLGLLLGQASGIDQREVKVAYYPADALQPEVRDTLVFDFLPPQTSSSFTNGFACIIKRDGKGSVVGAAGVTCSATLGAAVAVSSASTLPPQPNSTWLIEIPNQLSTQIQFGTGVQGTTLRGTAVQAGVTVTTPLKAAYGVAATGLLLFQFEAIDAGKPVTIICAFPAGTKDVSKLEGGVLIQIAGGQFTEVPMKCTARVQ